MTKSVTDWDSGGGGGGDNILLCCVYCSEVANLVYGLIQQRKTFRSVKWIVYVCVSACLLVHIACVCCVNAQWCVITLFRTASCISATTLIRKECLSLGCSSWFIGFHACIYFVGALAYLQSWIKKNCLFFSFPQETLNICFGCSLDFISKTHLHHRKTHSLYVRPSSSRSRRGTDSDSPVFDELARQNRRELTKRKV